MPPSHLSLLSCIGIPGNRVLYTHLPLFTLSMCTSVYVCVCVCGLVDVRLTRWPDSLHLFSSSFVFTGLYRLLPSPVRPPMEHAIKVFFFVFLLSYPFPLHSSVPLSPLCVLLALWVSSSAHILEVVWHLTLRPTSATTFLFSLAFSSAVTNSGTWCIPHRRGASTSPLLSSLSPLPLSMISSS